MANITMCPHNSKSNEDKINTYVSGTEQWLEIKRTSYYTVEVRVDTYKGN